MKKLSFLIIMALLPMVASAYDTYVNGIFYNLSGDEASVTYKNYNEENLTYDAGYSGNVVIPSSFTYNGKTYAVTGIGGCAFCESIGLTAVIIPESVKSIGSSAFKSCNSLTAVTIPGSVTSIGGSAFRGCSGLTSVTIGDGVTSIGDNAFQDCASLTSVAIPNSVTSIGGSAFRGCKGLTDVIIPDGVTNIGGSAFQNCSGLTSVTIAGSVKSIGGSAFNGCSSLTSVTIPEGLTKIENTTFGGCKSLNSIIIPGSVTSIGDNAFINCSSLTSVTVPESVISVGVSAFEGTAWYNNQQGLIYIGSVAYKYKGEMPEGTEISIREGTVQIAGEAFYTCTGLSSITIPESVTRISIKAFAGCTNLTSITLLESIKTIGSYAFAGCTSLTAITIPNGVTHIDTGVFNYCTGLTSVTIQDGVTSIGYEAFHDCYNLTSVKLPESLTTIGDRTFMYCQSLTSISIPKNVTKIGFSAFCQCKSLVTAVLPSSLTEIQEYALGNCDNLKDVYCYAEDVPETERLLFDESPISTATLHVPEGSVEKYQKSSPWSSFGSIVALTEPDPVTFTKDQMATIILPTAPDASKGKYYKLDRCEDGMIVFAQELQPQARTPYIIVPNEDFSIDMNTLDMAGLSSDTVSLDGISFIGSYVRTELPTLTGGDGGGSSSSYYDIIDQTPDCLIAQISTEMSVVGALRAYLVVTWDDPINPGGARSPKEKMEIVLLDEGTGISDAELLNDKGQMINDKWYDLQGRHVGNGQLKPGIYIVGGKKILMRYAK